MKLHVWPVNGLSVKSFVFFFLEDWEFILSVVDEVAPLSCQTAICDAYLWVVVLLQVINFSFDTVYVR